MKHQILDRIKSRGYWRINFEPLVYETKLKTLLECRDIIEKNSVELRGWDYPHFSRRQGDDVSLEPGDNYYEGWINWLNYIELWRMYQSGQFIHYFALREDWAELNERSTAEYRKIIPGEILNVIGEVTYELTEIFEFLSRLTQKGIYNEGVRVSISLNNTKGRKLVVLDPRRGPLFDDYKTNLETIEFVEKYTKDEIITNPRELALEVMKYIFERFGWHSPPLETIRKDQDNLLNRKI